MKKPRSQLVLLQYQVERLLSRKSMKFGFTASVTEKHDEAEAVETQPASTQSEHEVPSWQKKTE